MNKLIFLSLILFLCTCNGVKDNEETKAKSCECVNTDGVQVSVPSDISKEEVPGICSQLGGETRNCS